MAFINVNSINGSSVVEQSDGQQTLETLVMLAGFKRADLLNGMGRAYLNGIEEKNKKIESNNAKINAIREAKSSALKGEGQTSTGQPIDPEKFKSGELTIPLRITTEINGVIYGDTLQKSNSTSSNRFEFSINDIDNLIEDFQAKNQSLASSSNLELTQMQATLEKYNITNGFISNAVAKILSQAEKIVQNMR